MKQKAAALLKNAGLSNVSRGNPIKSLVSPTTGGQAEISQAVQQATQHLNQLTAVTQNSIDTLSANPSALTQNNASAYSSSSSGLLSSLSGSASGLFGGVLSFLPLISGIESLFGGGSKEPTPLVKYQPPDSEDFELAVSQGVTGDAVYDQNGQPRVSDITELALQSLQSPPGGSPKANAGSQSSGPTSTGSQITVQVQAMDSRSFLDHSDDIAAAVRQAMLNMSSINDVVSDL